MNTVIPNKYEQQIILICKGHYGSEYKESKINTDDRIELIKNIIAQYCGLQLKYIDYNVIYRWLLKLVQKYSVKYEIDNFLENMFKWNRTITIEDAINSLISILSGILVLDKNNNELIKLVKDDNILNWRENNEE